MTVILNTFSFGSINVFIFYQLSINFYPCLCICLLVLLVRESQLDVDIVLFLFSNYLEIAKEQRNIAPWWSKLKLVCSSWDENPMVH